MAENVCSWFWPIGALPVAIPNPVRKPRTLKWWHSKRPEVVAVADAPRTKSIEDVARPTQTNLKRDAELDKLAVKAKSNAELLNVVPGEQ